MSDAKGCGDNSCIFGPPGGMATNGGCCCLDSARWDSPEDRWRVLRGVASLRSELADVRKLYQASMGAHATKDAMLAEQYALVVDRDCPPNNVYTRPPLKAPSAVLTDVEATK